MKIVKFEAHRYEMGDLIIDAIPSDYEDGMVDYFLSVAGEFHRMYMATSKRLNQGAEEKFVVSMIAYEGKLAEYWREYDALVELYDEPDFGEASEGCNGDGQCDDDCCMHCGSRSCLEN